MTKRVGLLWDSASPNMGDQAIGLVLQRLLKSRGLEPVAIDPFEPGDLRSLDALVIGGGELIRAPGHPFYDVFRAKGPCILNTIGVIDGSATNYLEEYAIVSVRSAADRERLGRGEVVPCLTMLMDDQPLSPSDLPIVPPGAIGIHANFALAEACYDLLGWLQEQDLGPVVFLPLTHYNADYRLMQGMHRNLPNSMLLPPLGPDEAFRTIGRLRGLISCSLHGAMFAYAQQIPFMALSSIAKIRSFLDERGLSQLGFERAAQVVGHLPKILDSPPEVSQLVDQDQRQCRALLDRICSAVDHRPAVAGRAEGFDLQPASRHAHATEMETYRRLGESAATHVQYALSRLLQHEPPGAHQTAPGDQVGRGGHGEPIAAIRNYSDLLLEVDALRQERSLLMDEIGRMGDDLGEARGLLAMHLRSWPGRMLMAYWRVVNQIVPYGSRRRAFAKRLRHGAVGWLRRPVGGGRRQAHRSGGGRMQVPLAAAQTALENWVSLKVADPAFAALVERTEPSEIQLRSQLEEAASWTTPAVIEMLTEVRQASAQVLLDTFRSAQAQTNPHWLWRIVLAPRLSGDFRDRMHSAIGADPRIRIRVGPSDFSAAANLRAGLEASEAPLLTFLNAGDLLSPHALYRFDSILGRHPEAEIAYSDFDHVLPSGWRVDPLFKPDWSPAAMLSTNLLANMAVFRRSLLERAGFPDPEMGEAHAWDLALRFGALAKRIEHLPEILLHVGNPPREQPLPEIIEATQLARRRAAALRSHLRRQGLRFPQVEVGLEGRAIAHWGLSRTWRVSVIIPTKENRSVLERCVDSVLHSTDHAPVELILVDTGSSSAEIADYYRSLQADTGAIIEHLTGEFNFGRACNRGAAKASGDLLLFLNNDTEALNRDWMSRMIQWFELDNIGVVGGKLLYPDGRIQHAGVIVGMGGLASHVFMLEEEGEQGMFGSTEWYREYSAVTAACMLVRRESFEAVNGFDEGFVLNYSDVDLCLRIGRAGWRTVYTPDARLLHHESYTHHRLIPRQDFERASQLWTSSGDLRGDPYFNPGLSYMNPRPDYRRQESDNPQALNARLMRRLPHKAMLNLPEDLA